jgi:hypothetical protein
VSGTYTQFHDMLLPKVMGTLNEIYLRSINQKRLFAKKRLIFIKRAAKKYNTKEKIRINNTRFTLVIRKAKSFDIEIEFDHFIVSSRSCMEHLIQLVNQLYELNLEPSSNNRNDKVDIDNTIRCLQDKNSIISKKLGSYLKNEKQKDWYKTLHKLRIEMFHNKFERFITKGEKIEFEFPNGKTVGIIDYCESTISNLERVLSRSMKLISLSQLSNPESSNSEK